MLLKLTKPKLYILAYQYVNYNTRIHKQALLLNDLGFDVHVVCFGRIDNERFEDKGNYCIHRVVIKSLNDRFTSQWYKGVTYLIKIPMYILNPRLLKRHQKNSNKKDQKKRYRAFFQRFFKVLFITEFTFKCANVIERAESNVYFAHDLYALPIAYLLSRRHNCQLVL